MGANASGSWILDWIADYIRTSGPKAALQVARALAPLLREQATKSENKFDDYFAKQAERIANDPEFIALVEGVG